MNRNDVRYIYFILTLLLAISLAASVFAQEQMPVPLLSPKAIVTQRIGLTDITISYHRPGVKGRKIWGGLLPYGVIWRAGANENTTISFTDSVTIEGHPLPAGTYGFHMIPTEKDWTIIFSKNYTSWGSFFYREEEDALRIKVTPQPAEYLERLRYEFNDLTDSSTTIALHWENLMIPFKVKVDFHSIVIANARNVYLRGPAGFTWQAWNQAAAYCLRYNRNFKEALSWVEKSISMNKNFSNLRIKQGLLEKMGRLKEAAAIHEEAMSIATESELNGYGYELLANDKIEEAIEIFKQNVKSHPASWNAYDRLAEAYEKSGNTKLAIENYQKALKLVSDEINKKRISQILKHLTSK